MSNVLKVTTPATGYENTVKNNPATGEEKQIQNPVDPGKVIRPDGRTDSGQNQNLQLLLSSQSNFGSFLQRINDIPELTQLFSMLLMQGEGNLVEAGIGPGFTKELEGFMEMMQMTEKELLGFLKSQTDTSVRYKGAFFTLLKDVMGKTSSVELRTAVLDFLKRYNDMSSGSHLLSNIDNNLKEITQYMFRADRQGLQELMAHLNLEAPNGETYENVRLLKQQIIPFLSSYINKTHDLGKIRDLIGVLTFNISRYENGNTDRLMQGLQRLLTFTVFKQRFEGIDEGNLMAILQNTDFEKASKSAAWADKFVDIIKMGISGEAGLENKQVFGNLMSSILLNESVYMPILHLMLPINLNGKQMFSELWIDPDEENGPMGAEGGPYTKLLIKFDIRDLGFFDLIMLYGQQKVDMELYYPESLAPMEKEIQSKLTAILEQNGLTCRSLALGRAGAPKTISEVFPKIFERRNAINVTI